MTACLPLDTTLNGVHTQRRWRVENFRIWSDPVQSGTPIWPGYAPAKAPETPHTPHQKPVLKRSDVDIIISSCV